MFATRYLATSLALPSYALKTRVRGNCRFARQVRAGKQIDISCLKFGGDSGPHFLSLPGELFVEYQLAAQKLVADAGADLLVAAYAEYGPGYIGPAVAYGQGGYETGPASRVAPEVEGVLMDAIRRVLARTG